MARAFKTGITADGDVSLTGKLFVNASAGDEGGEIFLNKPVTNTSISGGVNIDVYQNKLRIWEDSGTNRGVYIDMTAAGAGVGTNLLAGGGGGGGTTTNALTISSPLTGTSFNGSSAVTIGLNQSALSIGGNQITSSVVSPTYGGTGVNNGSKRIFIQSGTPASPVAGDVWIWY